ncbi:MAG: sigma-70 family RNA polymerase sigma factor [Planctomycetes bacterium]|nr:sigma-70 family RNA polymerase sigma factor [Planctomycetota bacterium]
MKDQDHTHLLIAKAKDGDRAAFEDLATRFRGRLQTYIVARAKFRLGPRLDVEEILQETFVRAFESLGRFEWQGEDSFFTWLCGIAKNVIFKIAGSCSRNQGLQTAEGVPAMEVSPSKAMRRNERFDRLQKSLEQLDPDYREALYLARIERLRIEEVAKRLNRTPNAVRQLIARALKQLRERFGDTESLHLPDRSIELEGGADAK